MTHEKQDATSRGHHVGRARKRTPMVAAVELAHREPWVLAGLALGVGVLVGSSTTAGGAARVLVRVASRLGVRMAIAAIVPLFANALAEHVAPAD